ncbi:MAG: RHS repeat protein [Myxococcales bacterium]
MTYYDAAGNVSQQVDALGGVTDYAYDDAGRLLTVTQPDPDGSGSLTRPVTTYTYDKAGNLLTTTDPLGRVTTRVYDNRNRLIEMDQADPDGSGSLICQ